MDISPESNARFKAFRQLVYHCSEQLTHTETDALVYIWLYNERESYKNVPAIRVLAKLESKGQFGPLHPEGLLEMLKEVKRNDLCNEVRDFMKTKWRAAKKDKKKYFCDDEDLQATFEVVLAQTTVLLQQIEAFQKVLMFGRDARGRAKDVISGAVQTAKTLSDRLVRAEQELYHGGSATETEYVDMISLKAPPALSPTPTLTSSVVPETVSKNKPTAELGDYVDISAMAPSTLKRSGSKEQESKIEHLGDSTSLADYYNNSLSPRKAQTTVGVSSAVGRPSAEFDTQHNVAHTSSDESSLPATSPENSPRHVDSSSEVVTSPQHEGQGAVYCNIDELKAKLFKSSPDPSHTPSTSPGASTPPTAQERAIYSNIPAASQNTPQHNLRDFALSPRDVQRPLNVTMSLPIGHQTPETPQSVGRLPPSIDTPQSGGRPPTLQRVHENSEEEQCLLTNTDSTGETREDLAPGLDKPSSVTRPPVIAPKRPRTRPKPEIPPRRSSLSHLTHLRVGSDGGGAGGYLGAGPIGSSRTLKCVSVVGSIKNSIRALQNEPASNHDDSCDEDDTYMDMAAQKISPLQGGADAYYSTHLQQASIPMKRSDDSDKAYVVMQHQNY